MKENERYKAWFDTISLRSDIRSQSVSSGFFSIGSEAAGFVLQLGSVAVLARILMPEHFGLMGMIFAITSVAERFKDLGLSIATVQKKEITQGQVSTLFWINATFGIVMMTLFCGFAKVIAWFYGEARLFWVTVAISTNFFWGGLVVQHQALLRRQMHFGRLALINTGATMVGIGVAISLAVNGYEYWALVWRELARSVVTAIGSFMFCHWIPDWPRRDSRVGGMIRFGRDVALFNLVEFLSRNLDQILIGKIYGPGALGLYRQAFQLLQMPINYLNTPLHGVAEPALSVVREDFLRYRQWYKKILEMLSFVSMPLVAIIFVHSTNIIMLLLGEKWIQAADILKVLAVGAFIKPVVETYGFVLLSCGQSKKYLRMGLTSLVLNIMAVCIGINWGMFGVAIGYSVASYALVPLVLVAMKDTPVSAELFLQAVWPAVIASLVMVGALLLMSRIYYVDNPFYSIASSIPFAICAYLMAWVLLPDGKHRLGEIFTYGISMFRTK